MLEKFFSFIPQQNRWLALTNFALVLAGCFGAYGTFILTENANDKAIFELKQRVAYLEHTNSELVRQNLSLNEKLNELSIRAQNLLLKTMEDGQKIKVK